LVSIPVKAFTANASGKEIHLNQLHDECKCRIKYQKVCPQHGEVSMSEIVKGYEFAKDQYVIVDEEELDDLRTESDKAISIDSFVRPQLIDTLYYSGKTYYLTPDGPVGQKPYSLLLEAMKSEELCSVAQVVMHGKEQLVVLRPMGKLLCMEILAFEDQVKSPAEFESEVETADLSADELDLTKKLIGATTRDSFDIGAFPNTYYDKLKALIEAKIEGKEIVAMPEERPNQVINLMDALRASVAQAEGKASVASTEEPASPKKSASKPKGSKASTGHESKKKMAGSQSERKKGPGKKKTG
jgi:DNA end-binding protein Ku